MQRNGVGSLSVPSGPPLPIVSPMVKTRSETSMPSVVAGIEIRTRQLGDFTVGTVQAKVPAPCASAAALMDCQVMPLSMDSSSFFAPRNFPPCHFTVAEEAGTKESPPLGVTIRNWNGVACEV